MNDQIKKQTNLGIILAIIGFAMVGGALVLVPRLVDEKVKRLRLLENSSGNVAKSRLESEADQKNVQEPSGTSAKSNASEKHQMVSSGVDPKKTAETNESSGKKGDKGANDETTSTSSPSSTIDKASRIPEGDGKSWELVLEAKYEPDAASKQKLQTVITMMKSTPGMRIRVVGMNNINKMSKLAQLGANRIAGKILKEAGVPPERIEVSVEQKTGMTDIRVHISVVGGAR